MSKSRPSLAVLVVALAACSGPGPRDAKAPAASATLAPASCEPAPTPERRWNHRVGSRATRAAGSARHGTSDVVARVGQPISIRGRFLYGPIHKDLEDEVVAAWIEDGDCNWRSLGSALTDDDGVVTFELEPLERVGSYNIELIVAGDGSRARGAVWVLAADQDVVVFDVDGTLTTGDDELAREIITGDVAEMAPAADKVVSHYVSSGIIPIYMTGRPTALDKMTRRWLRDNRFAPGPILLTHGVRAGVLSVREFKQSHLVRLKNTLALDVIAAYGNASTDICAYAGAGIEPRSTFIIGRNAGEGCEGGAPTIAVQSYSDHLETLAPTSSN